VIVAGVIAYALVALCALRSLAGHFAWRAFQNDKIRYPNLYSNRTAPGGEDWFGGYLAALGLVAFWPLVAVVVVSGRLAPTLGAEREAKLATQARRIEQLERELELER
jgi:hypothetical protein